MHKVTGNVFLSLGQQPNCVHVILEVKFSLFRKVPNLGYYQNGNTYSIAFTRAPSTYFISSESHLFRLYVLYIKVLLAGSVR